MAGAVDQADIATFWTILGVLGGIIFYGRFYVQWLATESKRRSVMPITFWYMSMCGSLLLLTFAVAIRSPLGALGYSFNNIVYSRNLIHIWRERGKLTKRIHYTFNGIVVVVSAVAIFLLVTTWTNEYQVNQSLAPEEAAENWFWLTIGVIGQLLFASRFLIQWITSEIRRQSVIPTIFWHLSLVAAILQISCFVQRAEWVFAIGMSTTLFIYARNLWFIYAEEDDSEAK